MSILRPNTASLCRFPTKWFSKNNKKNLAQELGLPNNVQAERTKLGEKFKKASVGRTGISLQRFRMVREMK